MQDKVLGLRLRGMKLGTALRVVKTMNAATNDRAKDDGSGTTTISAELSAGLNSPKSCQPSGLGRRGENSETNENPMLGSDDAHWEITEVESTWPPIVVVLKFASNSDSRSSALAVATKRVTRAPKRILLIEPAIVLNRTEVESNLE